MKTILCLAVTTIILAGCGDSADQYQGLIDEYKHVMCVGMDPNASMTAKTEALNRQLELNQEYQLALQSLPPEAQQKLIMAWTKVMAEVADGNCP
ncbi:MAG: hypothetical protein MK116_07225 [Phycisphaerales bacterium]|nr:hypothetical protein [Phycisphaerales bacterium]